MKYKDEQYIKHANYKFTSYSRPHKNSDYTGSGQTILRFLATSIQCTLSDLQPCIQLISLEMLVSDNSTKGVIL